MNLLLYAGAAIIILGMLGTAGYKIRESGKDSVRVEWAAANDKAKADAEAERARQDAVREAQDKEATRRLADAKRRSATLLTSLEAHIRAAPLRADCRIGSELLGDVNSALSGGQSVSPGAVPAKPGPVTPSR